MEFNKDIVFSLFLVLPGNSNGVLLNKTLTSKLNPLRALKERVSDTVWLQPNDGTGRRAEGSPTTVKSTMFQVRVPWM